MRTLSDVFFSCVERSVTIAHEFLRRIHLVGIGNSGPTGFILQPDLFQRNTNNPIAKKNKPVRTPSCSFFQRRTTPNNKLPQPQPNSPNHGHICRLCRRRLPLIIAARCHFISVDDDRRGRGECLRNGHYRYSNMHNRSS